MIQSNIHTHLEGSLPDKRLAKRAMKILNNLEDKGSAIVNQSSNKVETKMGTYRFLGNDSFDHNHITDALTAHCGEVAKGHVLCLSDTTDLNFTTRTKSFKKDDADIGSIGAKGLLGMFGHISLAISTSNEPFGLANLYLWNREREPKSKIEREYKKEPTVEKESYRWVDSCLQSNSKLKNAEMITHICDRESDIIPMLTEVPNKRCHLLIRSCQNRRLANSDKKLFECLESIEASACYELKIEHNKKRQSRIAQMELRYTQVTIQSPPKIIKEGYPSSVEVYAIEAREVTKNIPKGESPVLWRLLTTHKIVDCEMAKQCVEWYAKRWYIEELFRVIKTQGFKIESSQLKTGKALKKLLVLVLQAAVTILYLKIALDKKDEQSASVLFDEDELECMGIIQDKQISGNTKKSQNPYKPRSLAWCAWIIARLGAWSGYASHGVPGYITLKNGYNNLLVHLEAYKMFRIVYKE